MVWSAHVTVATIVERSGQFLVVQEQAGQEYPVINQPAGHLEAGESLLDAAVRETLEETRWLVQIDALVGVYMYTPPPRPDLTFVRFCFAATPLEAFEERTLDTGIIDAFWLTAENILNHPQLRSPMVAQCLKDYLQGQRHPLSLLTAL